MYVDDLQFYTNCGHYLKYVDYYKNMMFSVTHTVICISFLFTCWFPRCPSNHNKDYAENQKYEHGENARSV